MAGLVSLAGLQQQARAPMPMPVRPPSIQVGPVQAYMDQRAQQYQGFQQAAQQQQTAQVMAANPYIGAFQQQASMFGAPQQPDTGGGPGGLFGAVANIGSTALDVFNYGRRAVQAGGLEIAQALPGNRGGGEASWEDFTKNLTDPSFGFKDLWKGTGNPWLDNPINFVGDVATDPLTYVTLGSTRFMGSAGRSALAELAQSKGLSEEVINRLGRIGESALSAGERETLGIGKAGLRFGIPSANVRLPGTGGLAQAGGRAFAGVRAPFAGTAAASAVRKLGGGARAPALRPFVERLAGGHGDMSATAAAATYGAQIARAGTEGEMLGRFAKGVADEGRAQRGRSDVYHALEAGADNEQVNRLRTLTESMFDVAEKDYGVTGMVKRQNYMPHYNTEVFNDFLDNATGDTANLVDLGAGSGRLRSRKFEPGGTYKVNGTEVTLDTATARDITDKFQAAFPELQGVKLIEDDPEQVLANLLEDHARDVGRAQWERRLEQVGMIAEEGTVKTRRQIAWANATKKDRKWARETAKARNQQYRDLAKRDREHLGVLAKAGQKTAGKLVTAEEEVMLERAQKLTKLAEGRVDASQVAEAKQPLAVRVRRGRNGPRAADDEDQLASLVGEINRLDEAIPKLQARVGAEPGDPAYQMALRMAEDRRTELTKLVETGRGASQRLGAVREKMRRAQEVVGQGPPRPPAVAGEGAGLELATPETAEFGARRQAVVDADLERQANEMDTAEMRLDALAGGMAPSGPEFEAADTVASQAAQNRQALLALKAPELNRRQALATTRAAQGEVARLQAPSEQFMSELATLSEGVPIRPKSEIAADIAEAGTDEARQARIGEALGTIRAPGKRITERGRRAVQRGLTLNELSDPNTLDASILKVLPPEIREALNQQATELGERLRPWTGSDKLHMLRPEQDIDSGVLEARSLADVPPATRRVQQRLNEIDAERATLNREVKDATRDLTMPAQQALETATQNRQVRLGKLRETRDRLQAFRAQMRTTGPMRKETQRRIGVSVTSRERAVDDVIAATEKQIAELEAKQQPRYEMWEIFEPESKDLFDDVRPRWETHLERLRTRRTNRAQMAERPGAPKPTAARNQARLAQLDQEIADTEGLLAALPPPPVEPKPRKVPVRVDKNRGTISYQKKLSAEELAENSRKVRVLDEEARDLRRGAPGARQAQPEAGVGELGAPMDNDEIREAAENIGRLNDFAVQYKAALDEGAPPGEATAARVARSVMENEKERVGADLTMRNTALSRYVGGTTTDAAGREVPVTRMRSAAEFGPAQIESEVNRRWDSEVARYETAQKNYNDALNRAHAERKTKGVKSLTREQRRALPTKPKTLQSESRFKNALRKELSGRMKQVKSATLTAQEREARSAMGELFGRILEPRARSVIEARKHRTFLKRLDAMIGAGRETEALESFQDILMNKQGVLQTAPTRQMQESEAAQLLGIGGKARPGIEIDTSAVIENLDEAARARVMEEENVFGQLLMEMTGTRWQESTRGQKALWSGVAEYLDPRTGVGPLLPGKRGTPLTPGRVATLIAGRGKAKRAEFLGAMFEKISPEARAQLLDIIERDARATTRRYGDIGERVARLGGGEAPDQVAGNWFELMTGKGRLGEAPETVDLSDFFGEGRHALLTGERALSRKAAKDVRQSLPEIVTPSPTRIGPEAQAQLDQLAQFQEGRRLPAQIRQEAAQRRFERAPGELAALEQEMAPLAAQEQAGTEAASQLAGIDVGAQAEELVAPSRQQLAEAQVTRGELSDQARLVRERIAARPQTMRNELSAMEQTEKILMGEGDEALDDQIVLDKAVKTAQARVTAAKSVNTKTKVNTVAEYEKLTKDVNDAIASGADPATIQLLQSMQDQVPKMQALENRATDLDKLAKDAKDAKLTPIIRDVFKDNWEAFTSSVQGRDLAINSDVRRAIENLNKSVLDRKQAGALGKALDTYTQFFKTYATLTPGFHVRNGLGAVFMNSSDGVSFNNQINGVKVWAAHKKNPNGAWWRDPSIPTKYRHVARDAVRAVYSSGAGGQLTASEVGAAASGQAAKGWKRAVFQNRLVRFSRRSGEAIEGAVRTGMALDTMLGGGAREAGVRGTVGEATARINRIHFNYSHVSEMDEKMRKIVPFWTFMSRNVPLQVQQMWLKPRTYLHYESFKRNFGEDEGGQFPGMPQYMRDLDAFRITPGLALAPEFGPSQMEETLGQVGTARMLSNLVPWIKTPAQIMTDRNFFYDSPYNENQFTEVAGELTPFGGAMGALGMTEPLPGGGTAVPTKYAEGIRDFIPTLAQYNRLLGTDPNRKDMTTQALWNFLGFPGKQLSPDVLAREQKRRRGAAYYADLDEQEKQEALAELGRGY